MTGTPSKHHTWGWLGSINKVEFGPSCVLYKHEKVLSSYHGNLAHESPFSKKKAFHKIMCQRLSKCTKNNCYVISRAFTQPALTAGIKNPTHSDVNKLISGLSWLLIHS